MQELTRDEISALLLLVEHHARDNWGAMAEVTGIDIGLCQELYYKLSDAYSLLKTA